MPSFLLLYIKVEVVFLNIEELLFLLVEYILVLSRFGKLSIYAHNNCCSLECAMK